MPSASITLYAKWTSTSIMMNTLPTSLARFHSGSLTSEGRVFVWGLNSSGQLGDGSFTKREKPVEITSRFNLAASDKIQSLNFGANHSSATSSLGRVFVWGSNTAYQLGTGDITNDITKLNTPTEITSRFNFESSEVIQSINLGWSSSTALTSNGRVFTWGDNDYGQLGDGTGANENRSSPFDITNRFVLDTNLNEKITYLSSSYYGSFALTSAGKIFAWGDNLYGQLGDNTTVNKNTPTNITSRFGLHSGEVVTMISGAGDEHSVAITNQSRVFTFGRNNQGQLGNGNDLIASSPIPIDITSLFNLSSEETIQTLTGGASFSIITTSLGRIMSWGGNFSGQLGNGNNTNQFTPVNIANQFVLQDGESVKSISSGHSQSFALTSVGRVFVWGANGSNQLGDGLTASRNVPFAISILEPTV
jgi:alpha-tubulin suppressor-like RCC1 family protein